MPIREDAIEEADSEKLYPLTIKFGNNGTSAELKIEYRAPTTDRVSLPTKADVAAALVAKWDLVANDGTTPIEPSLAYFRSKPIPFVTKIVGDIDADFFQQTAK